MRGVELPGGDGRSVAGVEGRGDPPGGPAEVGHDLRDGSTLHLSRGQAGDGAAVEDVGGGRGEPHPCPGGVQLAQPPEPGEQEVHRAVGVAEAEEDAQAVGHRARCARLVLRDVPGAAQRPDRAVDVAVPEPELRVDAEAGTGLVVTGQLAADDRCERARGRGRGRRP